MKTDSDVKGRVSMVITQEQAHKMLDFLMRMNEGGCPPEFVTDCEHDCYLCWSAAAELLKNTIKGETYD